MPVTGPSEPGGGGGMEASAQYFASICSLNYRKNIARPYFKFAKILTSSVTSFNHLLRVQRINVYLTRNVMYNSVIRILQKSLYHCFIKNIKTSLCNRAIK